MIPIYFFGHDFKRALYAKNNDEAGKRIFYLKNKDGDFHSLQEIQAFAISNGNNGLEVVNKYNIDLYDVQCWIIPARNTFAPSSARTANSPKKPPRSSHTTPDDIIPSSIYTNGIKPHQVRDYVEACTKIDLPCSVRRIKKTFGITSSHVTRAAKAEIERNRKNFSDVSGRKHIHSYKIETANTYRKNALQKMDDFIKAQIKDRKRVTIEEVGERFDVSADIVMDLFHVQYQNEPLVFPELKTNGRMDPIPTLTSPEMDCDDDEEEEQDHASVDSVNSVEEDMEEEEEEEDEDEEPFPGINTHLLPRDMVIEMDDTDYNHVPENTMPYSMAPKPTDPPPPSDVVRRRLAYEGMHVELSPHFVAFTNTFLSFS